MHQYLSNKLTVVPFLAITMVSSAGAVDLLVEDFSGSDGGFTVTNENHDDPWAYDAGAGAWSTDGSQNGAANEHTRLTSPELTVDTAGGYVVIFDHRYDIEGGDWDGAALYISVNGGPFDYVEGAKFTENGYNTGNLIGAHALGGLTAFGGISPGHAEGTYITSTAGPVPFGAGDIVQVQFLMANDQGSVGTMTPNWEIDNVSVASVPDNDSDGMPDDYEDANGLDKTMNDTAGDLDSDDSSNLDEYLAGTDPMDDDSDDDGIKDGAETNTGIYISATDTGTNPLSEDTDGDGLIDLVETNTGILVDAGDTGTNPNLADSDNDGFSDGSEIKNSSDPHDDASVPAGWAVRNATSSVQLNSIADTRALFATPANILTETNTAETTINFRDNAAGPFPDPRPFPVLGAQDVAADDHGLLATGTIFIGDPGIYTFGFNSDDGGGLFIDGEVATIADINRGSTTTLGAISLPFGNHVMEFVYWERGGGAQVQLFVAKEKGDKTGEAFDVANYELLETSFTESSDSDNDGLDDGFEIEFFGNLSQGADDDTDMDGLTNLAEAERGLDPSDDDSDDDGLKDGVEDGAGTFVSAAQTGTDPSKPDTDGDGLADGVEDGGGVFISATQTGSDPNKADTDGDRQNDGFEVTNSTDPNDAESKSAVATITVIDALLGGDLTDPEDDGVEGDTVPADGDIPQTAGTNFNWISIAASSEEYFGNFGGSEGFFDVFDNLTGGGQNKVCCNGAPQDITVGFEVPVSLTHFTLTSSNDTPARDPLDFQIQGSNDGAIWEIIYDRADDTSVWDARNQTVRFDLPAASDAYAFIRYAVSRTGGANHALAEIEYFGEEGSIAPPEITSVDYNSVTNQVTLTWNSRDNKTYSVFTSTDLTDFSEDINDSIPSEGDKTTFTFTLFEPVDLRRFFRVELNE
jgi:hypothetical protein